MRAKYKQINTGQISKALLFLHEQTEDLTISFIKLKELICSNNPHYDKYFDDSMNHVASIKRKSDEIRGMINNDKNDPINVLIDILCDFFQIPIECFKSKSKKMECVRARRYFSVICKALYNLSLHDIGSYMMNGDHTTILHHIRKFKDFYDTNDIYYMGYYKSLMEHLARNGYSVVTMEKFIKEINKNKKIR